MIGSPHENDRQAATHSAFSLAELAYLGEPRLGRLATIDADGIPHVVPLGWTYNPALETIDIGGRDFARTKKFRNVAANPKVAFLVDDVLAPWQPRSVMIQGSAEALEPPDSGEALIRITPRNIVSWGLAPAL